MRQRVAALVLLLFAESAARAGSYVNVALCEEATGCLLNTDVCHALCDPDCDDPDCSFVPPFAIVHPYGYTGVETALQLRICLEAQDAAFGPTLDRAISMWEALQSAAPNCQGCGTWEDPIHIDGTEPTEEELQMIEYEEEQGLLLEEEVILLEELGLPSDFSDSE